MKILITIFLLAFFSISNANDGVVYDIKIIRVIDGDTIAFRADWLPDPLKKELHLRIYGVDTPEKSYRAKCKLESDLGASASMFTKQQVQIASRTQIVLKSWDKYGGRVIGDLLLDSKSLRRSLIQNGYAKEYFGKTKESWCQ